MRPKKSLKLIGWVGVRSNAEGGRGLVPRQGLRAGPQGRERWLPSSPPVGPPLDGTGPPAPGLGHLSEIPRLPRITRLMSDSAVQKLSV